MSRVVSKRPVEVPDTPDTTMSLDDTAWYLNLPPRHEALLLDAGFIRAASPCGTRVSKASLDAFLVVLMSRAVPSVKKGRPIPLAGKIAGRGAVEIVSSLLDGSLTSVGLDPDDRGYLAVLVDVEDVRSLARRSVNGSSSIPAVHLIRSR